MSANLSNVLQSKSIDLSAASCLIQSTIDTFNGLRSDEYWGLIWDEIQAFVKQYKISPPRHNHRQRRPPSTLNDFIVTDTIGSTESLTSSHCEHYKITVYFAVLDVIISEMNERFSDINLSLMKAVCALSPKSDNFLSLATLQPFLDHYSASLPLLDNIQNEISIFRNYLSRNPTSDNESQGLHSLMDCIKPVQEAFPILSNCIQVALTIGISTATVERSFRRLKTYLRSTMTEVRLDSLALLYIERDISAKLWNSMDDLVVQFAQKHLNSRIVLL